MSDFEDLTGIKQPMLSQKLMLFREAEVVSTRREGSQNFCSMPGKEALDVMHVLYEVYCGPAKERAKEQKE